MYRATKNSFLLLGHGVLANSYFLVIPQFVSQYRLIQVIIRQFDRPQVHIILRNAQSNMVNGQLIFLAIHVHQHDDCTINFCPMSICIYNVPFRDLNQVDALVSLISQ